MIKQDRGIPFSVTASGTATAIATQAAATSTIWYITDISASTNAVNANISAGSIVVFGGSTVVTPLWVDYMGTNASYTRTFSQPLTGTLGAAIKVQAYGSSITFVNVAGFGISAA